MHVNVFFLFFLVSLLVVFLFAFFLVGVSLFGIFLLLLFQFLLQFVILLAKSEFVVGVLVHKHKHHVVERTPRSMAAHAVAVCEEKHSVSVEHPSWLRAEVSAASQVYRLLRSVSLYDSHVGIRVVSVADDFKREPFSIWRPGIVEATHKPFRTVGHLPHSFSGHVDHHKPAFILDESHLFSVGREFRILAVGERVGEQRLLVD